ncbi:MAG: class I SAM-dependent methyltransferase [Pararhodobacter sp.]|nr:class I SAM-dependent methyltransferase [Pararhodobacter sp.]
MRIVERSSHPAGQSERDTAAVLPPLPFPLSEALAQVDRVFGIDRLLADEGRDQTAAYYSQSEKGYRRLYSQAGCMHAALSRGTRIRSADHLGQANRVSRRISALGAGDVLELGAGVGFNSLHLARKHPDVRFTGVDLMARHVAQANKAAKDLPNASFRQGNFEALPDFPERFDIVFAVETLCYAHDLDKLCQRISGLLRPGGQLVIFDGYCHQELDDCTPEMALAARLYALGTAVAPGFRTASAWCAALEGAGLTIRRDADLSMLVRLTNRRLHALAMRFFDDWKLRLASRAMPTLMVRNAVSCITGPYTVEGPDVLPEPDKASLSYHMIIAEKPGPKAPAAAGATRARS